MVLKAFFFLIVLISSNCFAQEDSKKQEVFRPYHQVAVVLSHAHIFEGRDADGKLSVLALPAWAIDYTYAFHPKWAIGLYTDITVEKFFVEKNHGDGEVIERSYPVAPALMGVYKPGPHWSFILGVGGEFAKEENFLIARTGTEYSTEISKGWEVSGSFSYDFRWKAYDTWSIGIGISKSFSNQK